MSSQNHPVDIDVESVKALMKSGEDFLLLDVRGIDEYQVASITGSVLIPLGELAAGLHQLEPYRDKRIVVHCHHGGRSQRAVTALRQHGFEGAQNMTGGIEQWSLTVDPTVPRY